MSLPTQNDVQAVDPVLTNLLVGYMQADSRFVADRAFPGVSVPNDSGTYFIFTKKYWFLDEMKPRSYGSPFSTGGFGAETTTFATLQYALAYPLADEVRANSQVPGSLESSAAQWLAQQIMIRKERMFSTDFLAASVWSNQDNNSATDWDDYSSGDPVANILAGKRTISASTGYTRMSPCAVRSSEALQLHPDIIDRIKYTTAATAASVEAAVAAVLGLSEIMVSRASYNSANEAQTASYSAIIDDDFLLFYRAAAPGIMTASAGYTFNWQPGGGLGSVLPVYRDENNQRDLLRTKFQIDQKVVAADLGYIWLDIV